MFIPDSRVYSQARGDEKADARICIRFPSSILTSQMRKNNARVCCTSTRAIVTYTGQFFLRSRFFHVLSARIQAIFFAKLLCFVTRFPTSQKILD